MHSVIVENTEKNNKEFTEEVAWKERLYFRVLLTIKTRAGMRYCFFVKFIPLEN